MKSLDNTICYWKKISEEDLKTEGKRRTGYDKAHCYTCRGNYLRCDFYFPVLNKKTEEDEWPYEEIK